MILYIFLWTIWLECTSVTDFDLGFKLDKHPRPCFEHIDSYAVSTHSLYGLRCSSSLNTSISVVTITYLYKTIDLRWVTDKICHIMLYRVYLAKNRIRTHTVSGDGYLSRYWGQFNLKLFIKEIFINWLLFIVNWASLIIAIIGWILGHFRQHVLMNLNGFTVHHSWTPLFTRGWFGGVHVGHLLSFLCVLMC